MITAKRETANKVGYCNACTLNGEFVYQVRLRPTPNQATIIMLCESCRNDLEAALVAADHKPKTQP